MSALSLFDIVLAARRGQGSSSAAGMERLARLTEQLIRSALLELQQIEALDACLAAPDPTTFDEQAATLLRGMYDQWARDADAVLDRVTSAQSLGVPVDPAFDELRDAQGRVRAALAVTPQAVAEAHAQFAAGRTYTLEEVRRELRVGVQ
jgi:hypothetical protein